MQIKITADKIKDYIESYKSCIIQCDGVKIRPKFGILKLNFSGLNVEECELKIKSISGNGKIIIRSENQVESIIALKSFQNFGIPVKEQLKIKRPADGTGEIVLSEIILHTVGTEMLVDWKRIVRHCERYRYLRMVEGRLFADPGAFIKDNYTIKKIVTNPDGVCTRDGSKLLFSNSCEIIEMDMKGTVFQSKIPYKHREAPSPQINVLNVQPVFDEIKTPKLSNIVLDVAPIQTDQIDSGILFNSTRLDAFSKFRQIKNKFVKLISSNGKNYLLIRKGGKCFLSVSNLNNETVYIIIVRAKRLNGNGKLLVALSHIENEFSGGVNVVFDQSISNKYVVLSTKTCPYGQFQKINFAIEETSSGEILIEEVLVVENIGLNRTMGLTNDSLAFSSNSANLSDGSYLSIDNVIYDIVYRTAKKYAIYTPIACSNKEQNVFGQVSTTTTSGLSWINKICSACPQIKNIKNINITNQSFVVSRLGALISAKQIWIDSFNEKELRDKDISILKLAKKIYSPSLKNVQMLTEALPNSCIELCPKLIPYINPKPIPYFKNKEFVLSFYRDSDSVNKIIQAWQKDMPMLVLVGARGNYPNNVLPVNEYMPYDELLFLLENCKIILDIPAYIDYHSAFLELGYHLGVPIVSSNWFAIDKKNCIFLPSTESVGLYSIPSEEAITDGVNCACKMSKKTKRIDDYKKKFISNISKLFSIS